MGTEVWLFRFGGQNYPVDPDMTTRYNPFVELERLFERMSRQFAEASKSWDGDEGIRPVMGKHDSMRVDLADGDDDFVVTVDLPGFDPDHVDLTLSDRTVMISANREETIDEEDREYIHRERRRQSLQRRIDLPHDVDEDGVVATMNNGVLTIRLPKQPIEEGQTIDIELD